MYGSKITSIRLARGYPQIYMAEKLGIKQSDYSKIERDEKAKLGDATLQNIADLLGVSVADIKSPMPIVMNFYHTPTHSDSQDVHPKNIHENLLEQLTEQLRIKDLQLQAKDDQIKHLLEWMKR